MAKKAGKRNTAAKITAKKKTASGKRGTSVKKKGMQMVSGKSLGRASPGFRVPLLGSRKQIAGRASKVSSSES